MKRKTPPDNNNKLYILYERYKDTDPWRAVISTPDRGTMYDIYLPATKAARPYYKYKVETY